MGSSGHRRTVYRYVPLRKQPSSVDVAQFVFVDTRHSRPRVAASANPVGTQIATHSCCARRTRLDQQVRCPMTRPTLVGREVCAGVGAQRLGTTMRATKRRVGGHATDMEDAIGRKTSDPPGDVAEVDGKIVSSKKPADLFVVERAEGHSGTVSGPTRVLSDQLDQLGRMPQLGWIYDISQARYSTVIELKCLGQERSAGNTNEHAKATIHTDNLDGRVRRKSLDEIDDEVRHSLGRDDWIPGGMTLPATVADKYNLGAQ